ncbi:MAG: DUF6443 domain-containing protein [Flavobacterium sp. JAD_PAG50586_2]|nr:MAG: DUF6443 domain-containing protein [Flavobacterium sp. JAD_PAG50586_2]
MKKLFILATLFPVFAFGQSTDQNYVKTTTYREPAGSSPKYSITYFDGLGRPMEQIAHKQSGTTQDIVTTITYDAWGRQNKEYLPVVSGSTLNYHGLTPADVGVYYGTAQFPTMATTGFPYSEKLFEASPLNRIRGQAAPGDSWCWDNKHVIYLDYQTNEASGNQAVKLFGVSTSWNSSVDLYDIQLTDSGNYPAGALYKSITKNENWQLGDGTANTTEEYKDKEGRVLLKRTFGISIVNGAPVNEAHDTYYVYDNYGNLTYVIPPLVNFQNYVSSQILDDLCYQYKYDSRNRLVEKKLPGKGWEFIVYNNQDKPVATGPALNPWGSGTVGWLITKYDSFGRGIYTGWYEGVVPDTAGRKSFQDMMIISWAEKYTSSQVTIDGVATNYTNDVYPTDFKLLTVNCYDNYSNPYTFPLPLQLRAKQYHLTLKASQQHRGQEC